MPTYMVQYEVQGPPDAVETGVCSSFELPVDDGDMVPTVSLLREAFPYVGTFHFRAKFRSEREEYAWLDLTDEDAPVQVWSEEGREGVIQIRALPLSFEGPKGEPEDIEEDFEWNEQELEDPAYAVNSFDARSEEPQDYEANRGGVMSKIKEATETVLASDVARDITKKGVQVTKSVGKQVGKLWGSIKGYVGQEGGGSDSAAIPTPAALETLRAAETAQHTNFSDASAEHGLVLQDLWRGCFPDEPFERRSPRWKTAGFRDEDPVNDLKGTGMLCLQCLTYAAHTHTERLQTILREQEGRSPSKYPLGVVANNITLMCVDVLKIRDGRYANLQAGYWLLFESPTAFEEVFVRSLFHLDKLWKETNATRADFGKLVQSVRQQLETVLSRNPMSLHHFHDTADRVGF